IAAASKISTGGILYEVRTREGADYLRQNSGAFEERYHPTAVIRDRQPCPVLAEFVPIQFDPDRPDDLREIEEVNEYEPNSITRARWIRPIHRRKPNQRVAHAILYFRDPQTANSAITS
ncbi:hypothetical protein GLOTRDRAFT_23787, partial [Gloeophyllum trabeum ATCC 11539]